MIEILLFWICFLFSVFWWPERSYFNADGNIHFVYGTNNPEVYLYCLVIPMIFVSLLFVCWDVCLRGTWIFLSLVLTFIRRCPRSPHLLFLRFLGWQCSFISRAFVFVLNIQLETADCRNYLSSWTVIQKYWPLVWDMWGSGTRKATSHELNGQKFGVKWPLNSTENISDRAQHEDEFLA